MLCERGSAPAGAAGGYVDPGVEGVGTSDGAEVEIAESDAVILGGGGTGGQGQGGAGEGEGFQGGTSLLSSRGGDAPPYGPVR